METGHMLGVILSFRKRRFISTQFLKTLSLSQIFIFERDLKRKKNKIALKDNIILHSGIDKIEVEQSDNHYVD